MGSVLILPRVIRASDAPAYLGIDKNKFNKIVKPSLVAVHLGEHSIGYDRLDLDRWWEDYKCRYGRSNAEQSEGDFQIWPKEIHQVSSSGKASGMSTKLSTANEFARALERVTRKKQKQS